MGREFYIPDSQEVGSQAKKETVDLSLTSLDTANHPGQERAIPDTAQLRTALTGGMTWIVCVHPDIRTLSQALVSKPALLRSCPVGVTIKKRGMEINDTIIRHETIMLRCCISSGQAPARPASFRLVLIAAKGAKEGSRDYGLQSPGLNREAGAIIAADDSLSEGNDTKLMQQKEIEHPLGRDPIPNLPFAVQHQN